MSRHSYTQTLVDLFMARTSEARRILRGACIGDIENMQIRARGHATISMYRLTPRREVG